jgi:hypothetical protein
VSLVGVFQRHFRVLVGSLVIFLTMMYSCHAMGVRGEIVELGRFLMGTVWHGVSFRLLVPRTVRIRCPARTPTRPFNGTRLPAAASRRPTAKARPDDCVQSLHKGRGRRALHPNHSTTLATLRTNFCPVADSCKQCILANRTPDQTFFAFAGCTNRRRCLSKCREHDRRL